MKTTKIVMIALLLLILYQVTFGGGRSYMRDLTTTQGAAAASGPASILDLKSSLGCQPSGYNKDSAYYTKSLTPGGPCGDMDYVRNQQRDYEIDSGIGGSLFSK